MNTYRGTYGQITNGSLSEERSTKERWMIDRQIEMVYAQEEDFGLCEKEGKEKKEKCMAFGFAQF